MYSKNVRKTSEEERKSPASLLKISRWGSCGCANEPLVFSVSGASTLNGLFQTIIRLKGLVSYSKRFH